MALLISIPILGVLAIIQSAIISTMPLLFGTTDIVLVVVLAWALQDKVKGAWQWSIIGAGLMTLLSALPVGIYFAAYLAATLLASYIRRRIWKMPFLGMLIAIFLGTLLVQVVSWLGRWLTGVYLPLEQVVIQIMLPSILLNLLIAIPIFFVMKDLAIRLYPEEIET
jgi:rod shape-determining protein MreD